MISKIVLTLWLLLSTLLAQENVLCGLDQVHRFASLFAHKRIGIIANHTAVTRDGRPILAVFSQIPNVRITALFGPEHGFKGQADAGAKVASDTISQPIPVYSLYGETRKPTPGMLKDVDLLVFDIQDIGARFYTYIWTMALAMEAAAEKGIPFVVLDRPNPITGRHSEGPLLERDQVSFVGMFPIPIRHGLTAGELARLFNRSGWLIGRQKVNLHVIPVQGWRRAMWFDQTGLTFIKPSPNMVNLAAALVYPGTCLLEGTNVSEGRGTLEPFLQFGAPWIKARELCRKLNNAGLAGVRFAETRYTPRSIKGMSSHPKYQDQPCNGCRIIVTDREKFRPVRTGLTIISLILRDYRKHFIWRADHFDHLVGNSWLRGGLEKGEPVTELEKKWQDGLRDFNIKARQVYLYR